MRHSRARQAYTSSYVKDLGLIHRQPSKRAASNLETSSQEGSCSSKSAKSSEDPFANCATNMYRLSEMRIEERQAQRQLDEKYFYEKAMAALMCLNNVNDRYDSSDKDEELMEVAIVVLFGKQRCTDFKDAQREPVRGVMLALQVQLDEPCARNGLKVKFDLYGANF
ncbi:hypothetical protein ACH5RR_041124 [Cinchona calisaya]|uniref:Uncharacterized protein n=1 Tax=Cinchona calisaya TaxID=153742 RepID=A0ABD2XXW5_9GENT